MFERLGAMARLGKQAGTLRADQSEAWQLGEAMAAEALAGRSPDLIRMIHERGEEGIDFYVQQVSEAAVHSISDGEVQIERPVTTESLTAVGIACGMALYDALRSEARRLRRGNMS